MQNTELRGWKRLKSFVLTLSSFLILHSSLSQTYPVQVTPVISGPNLPYLSYYGDQNQHLNLFVLLTDFTAPAQSVRLKLSFTGPNLRFETNPFASSLPIYTLNPGEPLLITGSDLLPYLLEQNLLQTEGNAVDLDKLPEGFYTLCVDVIKNDVNAEILSTNNCRSFYIQEIQPPLLNLPMKFSQVDTTQQVISFLWTQPLNYTPNPSVEIRYHFKLYEWIDTTNFNIFATGQGLVYEEETNLNIQIINTAFDVYLRSGYKYIWQVQAKAYDANTGAFLDLITQNGVSAPFWFNYGEKQSLQATLTNGLTLDLSAQAQNTRKGMAFWTITDDTPGEGLSDYEAYIIEYRKFDSTGVNPYDWHSDTLQNKNFDIYQLEPAQAYEVRVSALVGDYRTPILDTARFVTPPQVEYACNSETPPFSQTNYTPLQTAYAGMVFQLGQFELTVSEITALQQVGHYTGKGTIKHDFLGGAKCNVTFEDLLVDQEFVVREGEAQAVTDGAENWTNQHYLDMVSPYPAGGVIESYGFLNDSTVFVVVNGVQQTYTFPENGNLPIVVQGANNVEIQFWPDGTIVVTTYGTSPSSDSLDANADRYAEFEAIAGQEQFFDKKQYDHFASNYELISCENNFNYFVPNTAKSTIGTTQIKAVYHVRTPGYSASGVSFKLGGGYSTVAHTQENDTTFVLTLPERSFSYDVYAYYGEFKIGKLRVVSLEQKERKVRIVPLVALSQSESAIEQAVNSIYAPANVALDVKIDSLFSTADFNAQTVFSDPEVDGMQKYTAQMRALRDAYKETHELASNEYLLFVIPGFETAAIDGYMVRGKGLGFVKLNGNLVEFVHTMAHELGHGMGGLTHSWGEDVSKKGLTTNLLDYSTGTKLIKGQWEDLNEAPNVVSMFDSEEDGESSGNLIAYFNIVMDGDKVVSRTPLYRKNWLQTKYGSTIVKDEAASELACVHKIWEDGEFKYSVERERVVYYNYYYDESTKKYNRYYSHDSTYIVSYDKSYSKFANEIYTVKRFFRKGKLSHEIALKFNGDIVPLEYLYGERPDEDVAIGDIYLTNNIGDQMALNGDMLATERSIWDKTTKADYFILIAIENDPVRWSILGFGWDDGTEYMWDETQEWYINESGEYWDNPGFVDLTNAVGGVVSPFAQMAIDYVNGKDPFAPIKNAYDEYDGTFVGFIFSGIKESYGDFIDDLNAGGYRKEQALWGAWVSFTSSGAMGSPYLKGVNLFDIKAKVKKLFVRNTIGTLDKIYKTQKSIIKTWKITIATATNLRKGNFGEIANDVFLTNKGYKALHTRLENIDAPTQQGIDGVFEKNGEYFIVESKYHGTATLGNTIDGKQMSDTWINGSNRLINAVGGNQSKFDEILNSGYKRLLAEISPDGTVIYKELDANANVLSVFNP